MYKKYALISLLLIAGIVGSVWYAKRPMESIVYGPSEATTTTPRTADAPSDVVVDKPQPGTASAVPVSAANAPVPTETRLAAPACESLHIQIETATYVVCADAELPVFEAMQKAASEGLSFSGKEHPGLGFFVDSINGKKAEGGYYWFLYINGESSSTGASQTLVRPGDAVEWRYKQSY